MSTSMMRLVLLCAFVAAVRADYWADRSKFIRSEESLALGSNIVLNKRELLVNKYLMEAKRRELDAGFQNPGSFPPACHFFQAKADIEKSAVYSIIRNMPKGGALHIHDTALSSTDYILYNITYREHLYACLEADSLKLQFFNPRPEDQCWVPVKQLREKADSVDSFDTWLRSKLSLIVDNPEETYTDINVVWKAFAGLFMVQTPMLTYRPVFMDYFYNALSEFYKDNVNYVEVRGTLPVVYELNGVSYKPPEVLRMIKEVADQFIEDHPDFLGIKYIYAPMRHVDNTTMSEYITHFKEMRQNFRNFLSGFDLVGQEDLGRPLTSFVNELQEVEGDVKFFFHAGETNWNGMQTDMNLVDAVLLNATRIGHGYALVKHPAVLKEVKRRGIGIEVNPISNQVLLLVKDIRNHPASVLLAQDYPVVISSDDPGLWGAHGLSHDFYEAFMGIASRSADLRMLKQFAINSFLYSSMKDEDKNVALAKWKVKWNKFIDDTVTSQNILTDYFSVSNV